MSDGSNNETIDVSRNPSPKEEANQFSNQDEKRHLADQSHEIQLLRQKQGPLGRAIGCSDSSLTIAFALLILGFLGIIVCILCMLHDREAFWPPTEKLIAFELTVAAYVFGKKSGPSEN